MASGYGINGGQSRCFPFWQAVAKCYAETDRPGRCTLYKEDYIECLHHRKARAREQAIKREFTKIRKEGAEEVRRQAEIYKAMGRAGGVSVGLIERIIAKSSVANLDGVNYSPPDPSEVKTRVPVDFEPVTPDGKPFPRS